jgi:hypothetical protein
MERLSGALINRMELRYLSPREVIKFEGQAVKIAERILHRQLTEAHVDQFILRAKGEWLHRVTSIDMTSRQAHWLPVTVNLDTGDFDDNLPAAWRPRIGSLILDSARKSPHATDRSLREFTGPALSPRRGTKAEAREAQPPITKHPINLSPSDLLFDDASHRAYLEDVFGKARSRILIASAFLRISTLESLRPSIFNALERGVYVDVLWGYGASGVAGSEAFEYLKRMGFDATKNDLVGHLRYNKSASGSHAKIILWDRCDDMEACVGSYNWLSALPASQIQTPTSGQPLNASVCLRHPALVSRLIRCAVGWWAEARVSSLDTSPSRWREVARQLDENIVRADADRRRDDSNVTAELILDHDHDEVLRSALADAKQTLLVVSHKLGRIAEVRLAAGSERERELDFQFNILYGSAEQLDRATLKDLVLVAGRAGATLTNLPGLHAKLVATEDMACIGSYNYLSADPFGTSKNARELSVLLSGQVAAHLLGHAFRSVQRRPDEASSGETAT